MNTPIFNREFQHPTDGWYQIEASGDHPNAAAGVVQVVDSTARKSIVDAFNADAKAGKLRHGNEMLIDIEHFKDQPDKETRAYGWLTQLQNRTDGIYGQIRWTATGQAAVDGGDYRFFSTEYGVDDCQILNNGNPQRLRPLKLDGLTLTNMNNNRGQKAITNRSGAAGGHAGSGNSGLDGDEQAKAAWLFNQLVFLEAKRTKWSHSYAWQSLMNREPALYNLANGKYPAETILGARPDLAARLKLLNRGIDKMSDSASRAANTIAPKALEFLEHRLDTIKTDIGAAHADHGTSDSGIFASFFSHIKGLVNQGMTIEQAFNELKTKEKLFWTQAMLSFTPDNLAAMGFRNL